MLRSMYSGISGMKVNQTKLDVTGNNIANVGTTGFKSSRVRFQDMLSQNVSEALGPGRNTGGVNARQVGLGVQVAGIDTLVTQGMMQPTSRPLDVAVDGEGYFVVAKGALPDTNAGGIIVDPAEHGMSGGNMEISYTRDGAFTLDYAGNLLTSDGYRVMGYALQEKSGSNSDTLSIDYDSNGAAYFVDSDSKDGLVNAGRLVPLRIPDSVHVKPVNIATAIDMNYTGSGDKSLFDNDATADGIQGYPTIVTIGAYKGKEDAKIDVKWSDKGTAGTFAWEVYVNGSYKGPADGSDIDVDGDSVDDITVEAPDDTALAALTPALTDDEIAKYNWSFNLTAEKDKKNKKLFI